MTMTPANPNLLPTIGLTMGDPAGVGPELALRAMGNVDLRNECRLHVFGSWAVLQECCRHLGWQTPEVSVISFEDYKDSPRSQYNHSVVVIDHPGHRFRNFDADNFEIGRVSPQCGELAYQFIQSSIDAALAKRVTAVATGPINKLALQAAGHNYPGHTEMFAERAAKDDKWCMMQYSPAITCTFVTVHCGYAQVPRLLTTERILDTILLTHDALLRIRRKTPALLICGLNPHAGEDGLFGDREEERIIQPAVQEARRRGIEIDGPLPPDTVFIPGRLQASDAVICMYHDQGHIPVKALAFESAVNTTLGLSIVRTSVDHGTAFDIAWKGLAKPDSLFSAIRLAISLVQTNSPKVEATK